MASFTQDNHPLRVTTPGLGKDALLLERFTGEEHVSSPFRFTLEIVPGASPALRLPTSHSHELALASRALGRVQAATNVFMSSRRAPAPISLA